MLIKKTQNRRWYINKFNLLLLCAIIAFIFLEGVCGNLVYTSGVKLMDNSFCFKYLGCNAGFFGFDALVHFCGGVLETASLFFIINRFPNLNFFVSSGRHTLLKNILILLGFLALLGFMWELGEFVFDQYRLNVLHLQLLVPNHLAQPTNADTMGDIFSGIVGGAISGAFIL